MSYGHTQDNTTGIQIARSVLLLAIVCGTQGLEHLEEAPSPQGEFDRFQMDLKLIRDWRDARRICSALESVPVRWFMVVEVVFMGRKVAFGRGTLIISRVSTRTRSLWYPSLNPELCASSL